MNLNDHAILPFLSQFDPPQQAEGSLDSLGLYSIADALGVRLAPGVRERQSKPRYLTLALIGMAACNDAIKEAGETKNIPAWLAYEWLVVEALVRQAEGAALTGIPGRDKVLATLKANEKVCMRNYLKTPSVFGFHGIYRVLGTKAGLFDADGYVLGQGYKVLTAWQDGQNMAGFLQGAGPGRDLRLSLERAIASTIEAGYAVDPGKISKLIAEHFNPHELEGKEQVALWSALTHNDVFRAEYANLLTTSDGQEAWKNAEGSESRYHDWLSQQASLPMQKLLKAIKSFENLSRLLTDAFNEARWRLTDASGPVDAAWLSKGAAMREAAESGSSVLTAALIDLGDVDLVLRTRLERSLSWMGEPRTAKGMAEQLIEHHTRIQAAKPPNGKRPWLDVFGDGRVDIRLGYTQDSFEPMTGWYVHAYRTRPIWSFASDLGRIKSSQEKN